MPIDDDNNKILTMPDPLTVGPFWSVSRKRLRMQFQLVNGQLVVHGRDPDDNDAYVFDAVLVAEQKDKFIEAVKAGREPEPANDNKPAAVTSKGVTPGVVVRPNTVVITGTDNGDGKGPKRNYQLNLG